ncbi:DUF3768 domain-containing protein [Novosphingobium terrae]|uniref:DUF3768 domain-containing protein n=1 Tax=Novosphingobium terrae TaxID=2726189 RepID=UPI001F133D24|nr:DUF3768 domain-containing protein [Novosphingobium terrae]
MTLTAPTPATHGYKAAVAALNDDFRQCINRPTGHNRVRLTPAVSELIGDVREWPAYLRQKLMLREVMNYSDFSGGNDPYAEHDLGDFTWREHRLTWTIDYYDLDLKWRSPNPADPAVTARVMTIALAEEY